MSCYVQDGLLLEITFRNSRGEISFKINTAIIEIDDYNFLTISKTATSSTQFFQTQSKLKGKL